jgi:hypothetical protein
MRGQHKDDTHVACVSDFCGNWKDPGTWADLFQRPDGTRYIQLGGGWLYYAKDTPEVIEETSEHFVPFLAACDECADIGYAREHWERKAA